MNAECSAEHRQVAVDPQNELVDQVVDVVSEIDESRDVIAIQALVFSDWNRRLGVVGVTRSS
jgi:hypothetical protein